jgi:hypothetical protein
LFDVPIASWALLVSLLSFGIAMVALGWQVTKHFWMVAASRCI